MPRVCTVCTHPKRTEIDQKLASGAVVKQRIATDLGLTDTALGRHERRHLTPELIAALRPSLEAREDLAREAISHCRWLVSKAREQCEKVLERESKASGVVCPLCGQRPNPFKDWIDPLNRAITSLGKFTGELANDQLAAFFVEMGVRDKNEIGSRLALTRGGEELSFEEAQSNALETLAMVWHKRPDLRQDGMRQLERTSHAEVLTNGTNGDR